MSQIVITTGSAHDEAELEALKFRHLALARIIEPTSKLDSLRVLEEAGVTPASYRTLKRRLPAYAGKERRLEPQITVGQLGLERHGGRLPDGLWARVIQRLLALNACIWHNWLIGADELQTLDTLITAGIASSRAEAVRWALARIRARPSYEQLRARTREIEDLKAQF